MHPHVAFGVILGRLLDPLHRSYFGQDNVEQSGFVQQFEAAARAAFREDANQFVADAFGGNGGHQFAQIPDRPHRLRFYCEAEPGREAHSAQHPEVVFTEALFRIADRANHAGL